ncbi:alpha/beta hydrolase [Nocardia terpenica]|uniref:alpha/beta fold hydrolase n=1 Tax=Nocardia terpenica TaxID=455432 RepID=UPI001892FEC7|nr:alpha/beta hydrolase [Nocardia terpenica]MBF6059161.1 alpha/beta hydrolase [Nocardia terpenica]MBF6103300.1 alpha/beta hydrolase [Nocardia terpenica]MBF6110511.1 alpha/beta hydrolase [Nocardia terpenica]MBF6116642.1 alpha/beta hydrolase [Nocardia terpenica]
MTTSVPVTSDTLATPDGRLYYELRGSGPLVVLIGSPMHAAPFAPLADLLATDHRVLTTDPRGHFGSTLNDPESDSTPELRADDLARLIRHVDAGPATVFGSSGGAITTLALLQSDPELVQTAIAHEPPLAELLGDRDRQQAARDEIVATFAGGDRIGAIRKFMAFADIQMPEETFQQMFGGEPTPEELANDRYFYEHELQGTAGWRPDLDALRAVAGRVIIGIGADSAGQFCDRASRALGAELKVEPVLFPGGHGGFMENPVAFAARFREVVD